MSSTALEVKAKRFSQRLEIHRIVAIQGRFS